MTRCLMLDVDGVVVTGRPEDGRSWATDIQCDLGISPHRLQEIFFEPHWADILVGRKDLLDVLQGCLPQLSATLSAEEFVEYWFGRDARLDEAVLAACDKIRALGTRIFLATNQEHLRARYLMDRLGLSAHVDGIVYSAAVGARKPEPEFFANAAELSGAPPEAHLLVDDAPANVEGARQTGWSAVLWSKGDDLLALLERQRTDGA